MITSNGRRTDLRFILFSVKISLFCSLISIIDNYRKMITLIYLAPIKVIPSKMIKNDCIDS